MNERRQDFDRLQRFTREGEQSAFADVVRRHLGLVFATAMRRVEDAGAAQEVAQNVFVALARKAWRFAPDDSLPAWLHKAALLESKSWLRGELGRRRREQTAAALGTTMNSPDDQPAFHALVPLLDEALLSLRERDHTALLLRFYERQSWREVSAAAGVSEDAGRKRVDGALEKLTKFFKRRGFKTASAGAIAAGEYFTVVLKQDGSVFVWGRNTYGETNVPTAAQSGVIAIAAGAAHIVALKTDGSIVAWGRSSEGLKWARPSSANIAFIITGCREACSPPVTPPTGSESRSSLRREGRSAALSERPAAAVANSYAPGNPAGVLPLVLRTQPRSGKIVAARDVSGESHGKGLGILCVLCVLLRRFRRPATLHAIPALTAGLSW